MKEYVIPTPKDTHGQVFQIPKRIQENNVSKLIDRLCGICTGILCDGPVSRAEAVFFAGWVQKHAPLEPVWPFTDIFDRVEGICGSESFDDVKRKELEDVMIALSGWAANSWTVKSVQSAGTVKAESLPAFETFATTLPLDVPAPDIIFSGKRFNITGRFAFGTRQKVMAAIEERGGSVSDASPTGESDYLVIGEFASRDWANTSYGRKIERAVELREDSRKELERLGKNLAYWKNAEEQIKHLKVIAIVSEEHWKKFLV